MTIRVIVWMMVILTLSGVFLLAADQSSEVWSIGSAIALGPGDGLSLEAHLANTVSDSADEEEHVNITGRAEFSSDFLHLRTLTLIEQDTNLDNSDWIAVKNTNRVEMTLIPKIKLRVENEALAERGQFLVTSTNRLDVIPEKIDLAGGTVVLNFAQPQTLGVDYQFPHAIPLFGEPLPGLTASIGASLSYPQLAVHERFALTAVSPGIKIVGKTEFTPQPMETLTISAVSGAIEIAGKLVGSLAPYQIDAATLNITAARSVFSLYLNAGVTNGATYVKVGAAYNF